MDPNKDIDLDLHNLREFFKNLPGEIKDMLATLKEMALGSEPNDSADYFNKKETIQLMANDSKTPERTNPTDGKK